MAYQIVKFAHVLGAAALLGTGVGIAFFMLLAHRSGDIRLIAGTAGIVVIADALFTASAIVAQPLTGYWLARMSGASLAEPWLSAALALYLVAGAFWLPVVWIQIRLRDLAREAARLGRLCLTSTIGCFESGSRSAFRASAPRSRYSG